MDPMWVMRACNMRGLTVSMNGVEALARQLRYERASARLQVLGQVLDKAAELLERDQGASQGWARARGGGGTGRGMGDVSLCVHWVGPETERRCLRAPFASALTHTSRAAAATLARSRYQPAHHRRGTDQARRGARHAQRRGIHG